MCCAASDVRPEHYTQLLIGLEACFNGQPELMGSLARGTMPDLADAADALFQTKLESRPGLFAGPTKAVTDGFDLIEKCHGFGNAILKSRSPERRSALFPALTPAPYSGSQWSKREDSA